MIADTGTFATPKAGQYLQQLCKHFGHKVEVNFDADSGTIDFPFGPVTLAAVNDVLTIAVQSEDEAGLTRAREVVDKHLARFAFREAFEHMAWQKA